MKDQKDIKEHIFGYLNFCINLWLQDYNHLHMYRNYLQPKEFVDKLEHKFQKLRQHNIFFLLLDNSHVKPHILYLNYGQIDF